ncbi:hypothetical protein GNE08_15160 [Trichormus variabilis ARAD]|uniref:Uncharacterized protein n=1 Tax=Trichormus variabilis N2B TaxID=2681315 RepID=A0ABR6SB00_ANAVA|nr:MULTISPECIES: hypothetical protein [Nostocaceae]MBC1215558.1 hypothetical protein [Trichormus variabilis ARAD]MBC1255112.1 hypothetical protein [Trichormus variabilis V5]MBC1267583.1 hypothetical protein [Trichormus variabilis FSR]MBC1303575.1 hypothetical protein [Trichormus variabilis N2B]MBC1313141.1 hypothetical protein [Trichormus variabilis PNB]
MSNTYFPIPYWCWLHDDYIRSETCSNISSSQGMNLLKSHIGDENHFQLQIAKV